MENIFMCVTRLSLKACVVIPLVIAIRFLMRRQPKSYSYALWAVVFFTLVADITIPPPKNAVSDTPVASLQSGLLSRYDEVLDDYVGDAHFYHSNRLEYYEAIEQGIKPVYDEESGALYVVTAADGISAPATVKSAFVPKVYMLWFIGILVLCFVWLKNTLYIYSKIRFATLYENNIYLAENIPSPFVYGLFRPRIFIPESLRLKDLGYIIAHERVHIKRKDHIIKPLCLMICTLHWFNPLVWLAFRLMCSDMEMSCDEKVISEMGTDSKKDYSLLLLDFASDKSFAGAVLFGESQAESRIKNVLKYRKPAKAVALVLAVTVLAVAVIALTGRETQTIPSAAPPATFYEKLDSLNDTEHLQYRYRMGVEGNNLFPHAEYTVNIENDSSIYDVIHQNVDYDDYPNLINENSDLRYWSMLGNRIDDGEIPRFSLCHVESDNTFSISDYKLINSGIGVWVMQQPYPNNFPIDEEYDGARIVGHDKLNDNLYISSVITYAKDNTATLYIIRTENGESEIMHKGEAFTITRGIRFLNENVGFASSDDSHDYPTAKVTTDGGKTWQDMDFSTLVPDDDQFYVRNGCIVNIYGDTVEIRYHARYTGRQTHADDTYSVISFDGGLTWAGYYCGLSWDSRLPGMKYEKATETIPVMLLTEAE
ncbi:MAG: hypothetical protein IJ410_06095 [Oscillospiraceae bacterium]|nr:hypothetical protein [Oscillospiraceae bacterium]